jgi:hypothetical protein
LASQIDTPPARRVSTISGCACSSYGRAGRTVEEKTLAASRLDRPSTKYQCRRAWLGGCEDHIAGDADPRNNRWQGFT